MPPFSHANPTTQTRSPRESVLVPVLSGVLILLAVALVFNNLSSSRRYPANKYWYRFWQRGY